MKHTIALISVLSLGATQALAETRTEGDVIKVPVGQQASDKQHIQRPTLGMSKEQVERLFGEPQSWQDPKGEPPITRWEYQDFVVYFEGNFVIHSVVKTSPNTNK
ncbi:hypothetical protein R50073_25460 [Maricurvus nonylphenolicus]|uniref:hypothetical protein n=1 Tax=Maricurvus nonylphenolicus TaxID=1008307 RepID=UPI0036F39583